MGPERAINLMTGASTSGVDWLLSWSDPSGWLELEPGAAELEVPAGGFLGPQPASRDRDRAAVRSRERVRFMVIILSVEVFCRGRRLGGPFFGGLCGGWIRRAGVVAPYRF